MTENTNLYHPQTTSFTTPSGVEEVAQPVRQPETDWSKEDWAQDLVEVLGRENTSRKIRRDALVQLNFTERERVVLAAYLQEYYGVTLSVTDLWKLA